MKTQEYLDILSQLRGGAHMFAFGIGEHDNIHRSTGLLWPIHRRGNTIVIPGAADFFDSIFFTRTIKTAPCRKRITFVF